MPISQITPVVEFPPITHAEVAEAPRTAKYLKNLLLALRKWRNDSSTAEATATTAGLAANLPTAGTPGRLYYATDTHVLYGDDGTVWTAV